MLNRVWTTARPFQGMKVRVEEHIYRDSSKHYNFVTNFKSQTVRKDEADEIIKGWKMEEATEEWKQEGWIS